MEINNVKCGYTKPTECDGILINPTERRPGHWWAWCPKCERQNKLTVSGSNGGTLYAHASPIGPQPKEKLVRWRGLWVRPDQKKWLDDQLFTNEKMRSIIDIAMEADYN